MEGTVVTILGLDVWMGTSIAILGMSCMERIWNQTKRALVSIWVRDKIGFPLNPHVWPCVLGRIIIFLGSNHFDPYPFWLDTTSCFARRVYTGPPSLTVWQPLWYLYRLTIYQSSLCSWAYGQKPVKIITTIWLFNIAMEHHHFS